MNKFIIRNFQVEFVQLKKKKKFGKPFDGNIHGKKKRKIEGNDGTNDDEMEWNETDNYCFFFSIDLCYFSFNLNELKKLKTLRLDEWFDFWLHKRWKKSLKLFLWIMICKWLFSFWTFTIWHSILEDCSSFLFFYFIFIRDRPRIKIKIKSSFFNFFSSQHFHLFMIKSADF